MSSPSRSSKSFEFSAPNPPATTPFAVLDAMLGQKPALDVGRAAGGEVDDEREPLALVVGLIGRGMGAEHGRAQAEHASRHARREHFGPPLLWSKTIAAGLLGGQSFFARRSN